MAASSLTPQQQHVLSTILRIGRRRRATPKEIKAAVETGLVESNLTNVRHGDADSLGWRQERASLYKNPLNLKASVNRFFDETSAVRGKYATAGELAAAVQRPAAQYRGRYQQRAGDAQRLIAGFGGFGGGASPTVSGPGAPLMDLAIGHKQTFDQAGFEQAKRAALVGGLIARRRGTNNILFRSGLLTTSAPDPSQFVKTSLVTQARAAATPATGGLGNSPLTDAGSASDKVRAMIERANAIDAKHYNYEWGGGHNPGVVPTHGTGHGSGPGIGFDCSGAVSKVLGVDARVSGEFARWGKPGRAPGGKGVTVYANSTHVFLEINNHYFGTSGANPGGGAGWIPRAAISPAYLRNFTARHL